MNNFNISLGNKIKEIRNNLKISQEEFCNLIDNKISRSNLSKIEMGKISTTTELIKIIIETFNISPYYLLDLKEDNYTIEMESIKNYNKLNERDKIKVETYIDFLLLEKDQELSTSMNIEGDDTNKKSS
ncbi:MAG: helix-turn-helix domain-containing protein [Tissierellaceae bacterium]|nr:helix-turn-helix domain-containing protein [Tissierellaceae bacterium]